MKKYLSLLLILFSALPAFTQTTRDSLLNAVAGYTQLVYRAADTFLNTRFPQAVRLEAIGKYSLVYDPEQVAGFKRAVIAENEPPEIRAMALNKIYQYAENDEQLLAQVLQWLGNSRTPKPLRNETLDLVHALSFTSLPGKLEVYDKILTDPDARYRLFAASKLMANGDQRTQQLLVSVLEDSATALFTPLQAIALLSLAPKKEFYPAVYKILQQAGNEDTRLAALETLGAYTPAREKIISISRDPNEKEIFREAALMALYSGDKENIVGYVSPILNDKTASSRLQILCIQMTIDQRRSMAYRRSKKARRADEYDLLVKSFADGSTVNNDEALKKIAEKYLLLVKPALPQ